MSKSTLTSVLVALATTLVPVAGSTAATTQPVSKCKIVITGAQWHIRGSGSGSKYTLAAKGMSCSSARAWVVKFTHQTGKGVGQALNGPPGFKCQSFSEAASGDKLVYAGVCMHTPHNIPFFEWAPKK
jgi:hypothetical protein